jgi:ligand-binding sensor domain-containing protein
MNTTIKIAALGVALAVASCTAKTEKKLIQAHQDKAFTQDYSIKFKLEPRDAELKKVVADRNGYVQIHSSKGLLRPRAGQFLFPGMLVKDVQDRSTSDKKISGIGTYQNQLVYIDNKAVLSNAWAGKLYSRHTLPGARIFAGGKDFSFLISDGKALHLLKDSKNLWEGSLSGEEVRDIKFDEANNLFWILGKSSISTFAPDKNELSEVISGANATCIELAQGKLIVGTTDGYFEIDPKTKKQTGDIQRKMPWTDLTTISNIDGKIWFGSTWGAMKLREDGKFDYYASERWIPSDTVVNIAKGPENSVLILTSNGLGKICFEEMTLHEKAMFFEKQVRDRHIRTGFNATVSGMVNGDVTTGFMENSDNDGLWTSMYLAGETFRYAVTKSDEALQNVRESLDAMERLYTINPMKSGFPSRSFERAGYNVGDEPWRPTEDPEWDWKSTTSSDEAIGHIFAFGAIAELVEEPELKNKAILLIDTLMSHIVKNDFYMIDWNGKPTTWGRWNPEYVNARPKNVGDRKINSSNIIGMLQTAYHFTKKEKYKEAAFNLMNEHGYFENLMRPMKEIGYAPADADELSKELSDAWNHSDDEMYFCGYWGLYRYALNDTLKARYKEAIVDHFEAERPEKEGLWNIMTALVETDNIDLNEAVWYLQEYPLDLINWSVKNSQRKDITFIEPNFRKQTITEVLPPDELGISRHNANRFTLDENSGGRSENSAGDIWLLPYWIGRYLGVISEPEAKR